MTKTHPINLSAEAYQLLKLEQKKRGGGTLRHIAYTLIEEAVDRRERFGIFEDEVYKHLKASKDKTFLEYLNSSYCSELIKLLDQTRPTYQDIATMSAMLLFLQIKPLEFFKVLVTYAKYGSAQMKED